MTTTGETLDRAGRDEVLRTVNHLARELGQLQARLGLLLGLKPRENWSDDHALRLTWTPEGDGAVATAAIGPAVLTALPCADGRTWTATVSVLGWHASYDGLESESRAKVEAETWACLLLGLE